MGEAPEHSQSAPPGGSARRLGRYALFGEIARGGMATVHYGRLLGSVGFSRTVAIKRLHPQFTADHDFVSMFVDEARLAARIQHPNVIPTLDVVVEGGELALVMDYVQGASLARLIATSKHLKSQIPLRVVSAIMLGVLAGLHAAHEAKSERGEPLGIVHRDMSPQNVLVGADGVARVFDFGIAKAAGRLQTTREGQFKGKLSYAAPEQLSLGDSDRRTDLYSTSVILWELLTLKRLFRSDDPVHVMKQVLGGEISKPSDHVEGIPEPLEAIVMKGLSKEPAARFASAEEMAAAIEAVQPYASPREVAEWVAAVAGEELRGRAKAVEEIEISSQTLVSSHDVPTLVRQITKPELDASDLVLEEATSPGVPRARSPSVPTGVGTLPVDQAPPTKRGALGAFALVAIALLVAGGAAFAWVQTRPLLSADTFTRKAPPRMLAPVVAARIEDAPAPSSSASSSPSASRSTTASVVPSAPVMAPLVAPAPIASTPRPIASASVAPAIAASAPASAPPPPPSAAPAVNCSTPYTVDENGIRHPKPECL